MVLKRPKEEIAEDWCFVCKEGGHVRICDYKECLKVCHPKCVGKDDSFLESEERWICGWHECITCKKPSKFRCYTCPKSLCALCFTVAEFVLIKGYKGFCGHCLKLLALAEQEDVDSDGEKVDFTIPETVEFLFIDYWNLINKKEGLTPETIKCAYANYTKGRKSIADAEHDDSYESEDEMMASDFEDVNDVKEGKRKVKKQHHSMKKQLHRVSRNMDGGSNTQQTCFISMDKQNMELVYLRMSLVEVLSKHPQTFEGKVVGSFVRVESDPHEIRQKRYQLLQVTGIRKDVSSGCTGATLLQVSYRTKDVPISMLSDDDFTEEECEELRHNVKECLHRNVTRSEFEEKIRNVLVDITDHSIVSRNNQASDEGWRRNQDEALEDNLIICSDVLDIYKKNLCYEHTQRIQLLQNPTEQSQLLQDVPAMIGNPAETKPTPEDCKRYSVERRKCISPDIHLKETSDIPRKSYESNGTHCVRVKMETEGAPEERHHEQTHKPEHDVESTSKYTKEPARIIKEENVEKYPQQSNGSRESQFTNAKHSSLKDKPAPLLGNIIDLSDDEEKSDSRPEKKQKVEDLESSIWHCKSPHGIRKGPLSLSLLKRWSDTVKCSLNYKVWKTGQSEAESISLGDVVRFLGVGLARRACLVTFHLKI